MNSRLVVMMLSPSASSMPRAAMFRPWEVLSTRAISSGSALSSLAASSYALPRRESMAMWWALEFSSSWVAVMSAKAFTARTVRWGAKLTQAASRKTICSRTGHSCLRIASKSTDISTTSYIFVGDGWVVFLWFSFTGEATSLQSTDFLRSNAVIVKNYQLWSWENRL